MLRLDNLAPQSPDATSLQPWRRLAGRAPHLNHSSRNGRAEPQDGRVRKRSPLERRATKAVGHTLSKEYQQAGDLTVRPPDQRLGSALQAGLPLEMARGLRWSTQMEVNCSPQRYVTAPTTDTQHAPRGMLTPADIQKSALAKKFQTSISLRGPMESPESMDGLSLKVC